MVFENINGKNYCLNGDFWLKKEEKEQNSLITK